MIPYLSDQKILLTWPIDPVSHSDPMSDHQCSSLTTVLSYIQPTSWMLPEPTGGCSLSLTAPHLPPSAGHCPNFLSIPQSPVHSLWALYRTLVHCTPAPPTLLHTVYSLSSYSDLVHVLLIYFLTIKFYHTTYSFLVYLLWSPLPECKFKLEPAQYIEYVLTILTQKMITAPGS